MSLKKPSFDAIANAISGARGSTHACDEIATKIADYFAGQNKEFDVAAFLKASGAVAAPQQDEKMIGDK